MYPYVFAALALVAGLLVGWLVGRRNRMVEPGPEDPLDELVDAPPVTVPEGISQIIGVLRSSAVVVGPHDEVLQSTSPARTFGLVRGSRIAVRQILDLVRIARRDDEIHTTDLELGRGPGTPSLHLSVRVAPISEHLVLVLAEDRTAARRVEETRRDFVANVSHELKTPIGAISLLAEAVEDAADDPEAVRRFAGRMSKESDRLTELVRQIIDLSRLQADDPLLLAEEVDVDEVLALAVDRCRVDADIKGISLAIAGAKGCQVIGDTEQLTMAVTNLVENAVSYSDRGDRVAVAARRTVDNEDNFIELTVSDSGIGIAPGEVQRIFERFYRVDYARSRDSGGTGLGLSIVKHVAGAHGGQVSVWSQPGQGSTFTIRLPEYLTRDEAGRDGADTFPSDAQRPGGELSQAGNETSARPVTQAQEASS